MTNAANANWALPGGAPKVVENKPGRTADDIEKWRQLTSSVVQIATDNGWSKAEVARRAELPDGTFSQWFSGKYEGRFDLQNSKIERWLSSVAEARSMEAAIPQSPGFIQTRAAREITETLMYAQMMPDLVIITYEAGMGKTETCNQFAKSRPNAHLVTMSPNTKTVHGMLVELAESLDVVQFNPAKLQRAVGRRLERTGNGTLLVVDEAQNLKDEAVDQLRHFVDIYRCGVALVGNTEIYGRFHKSGANGPSYAQIKRRIGKRLRRLKPHPEDISAMIDAWGVDDPACRNLLTGIGQKDGALGQIDKTMKLASMLAAGSGETIDVRHIRAAWENRDVEGV